MYLIRMFGDKVAEKVCVGGDRLCGYNHYSATSWRLYGSALSL